MKTMFNFLHDNAYENLNSICRLRRSLEWVDIHDRINYRANELRRPYLTITLKA